MLNSTRLTEEEKDLLIAGSPLDDRNRSTADIYCAWQAGCRGWDRGGGARGVAHPDAAGGTCAPHQPVAGLRLASCCSCSCLHFRHGGRGAGLPGHLDVCLPSVLQVNGLDMHTLWCLAEVHAAPQGMPSCPGLFVSIRPWRQRQPCMQHCACPAAAALLQLAGLLQPGDGHEHEPGARDCGVHCLVRYF